MKIYSIYVLLEDGTCLYSQNFSPMPDESLISAMISAMQAFIKEVSGKYPQTVATGGFVFHIEKLDRLSMVLATSSEARPTTEMFELRTAFLHKFGQYIQDFRGTTNEFLAFEEDVRSILHIEAISERTEPKKGLTSFALLQIPARLQNIAREMVMKKSASAVDLKETLDQPELLTRMQLEELLEEGYIGRFHNGEDFIYFID